jgi:hypothetical protein
MKTKVMILSGIFTMVFLFVLGFSPANAAIPYTINYQGYLTNAGGSPVNGTVSMTFSLYTVASGGTALWTETQNVIVSGGIYGVILGSVSALTPLAFDVPYWLGVRGGSDAEMTPRVQLTSVGYAFTSDIAMDLVCPGCVNFSDIGQNGCSANQFMMWSGTAWTCSVPIGFTETDPQVGTLTPNLWCRSNAGGTAIDCATAAPITVETDPEVGALTANLWCRANAGGTAIVCDAVAPVAAETDPQVGTLTANLWCRSNAGGTAIDCATAAPITVETDPQVGVVTAGQWCVGSGTAVECNQDAAALFVNVTGDAMTGALTVGITGAGSALTSTNSGTGPGLTVTGGGDGSLTDIFGDLFLGGNIGEIFAIGAADSVLALYSNGNVYIDLDDNDDASNAEFRIYNGTNISVFTVDESGNVAADGVISGTLKNVNGGVPTACDASTRGMFWFTDNGSTKDDVLVCVWTGATYLWHPIY